MITPKQIIDIAAADMNDSAQRTYKWSSLRPYLNMALMELLLVMEENGLPIITKQISPAITVPAGETELTFTGVAQLPSDLIEPEMLWESTDGGNSWTPMTPKNFIDPNLNSNNGSLAYFGIYVWSGDKITVPPVSGDNLIKIHYLKNLISLPLTTSQENLPLPLRTPLFLGHKTAALCAALTAQDEVRAEELNTLAETALSREINIPVKTLQRMPVRRRPFRATYRSRGYIS